MKNAKKSEHKTKKKWKEMELPFTFDFFSFPAIFFFFSFLLHFFFILCFHFVFPFDFFLHFPFISFCWLFVGAAARKDVASEGGTTTRTKDQSAKNVFSWIIFLLLAFFVRQFLNFSSSSPVDFLCRLHPLLDVFLGADYGHRRCGAVYPFDDGGSRRLFWRMSNWRKTNLKFGDIVLKFCGLVLFFWFWISFKYCSRAPVFLQKKDWVWLVEFSE